MRESGILFYVNAFPKLSESFILNEIVELDERGHDIAVFAMHDPGEDVVHEEDDQLDLPVCYADPSVHDLTGVPSLRLLDPAVGKVVAGALSRFPFSTVAGGIYLGNRCAAFIDDLSFDVDVIHGHFATPRKLGELYAARYHDIPATVTAHAYEIFQSPNVEQIRYICEGVDHVVVPSRYNERYLTEEIGVDNSFTVVPATTKLEKFATADDSVSNRILTVGRLTEKKGHAYGIDAVARLVRDGHDVDYHIVGEGELKEDLRERVDRHGIGEFVTFCGHVSDERLQRELRQASVFLLPCVVASDGDRDAMPVVLKEAMAAKTACVSTTVSAIPELITDHEDGLLVPPRDAEALADALAYLLENRTEREAIAVEGAVTVEEKFDISRSVDGLERIFRELTGEAR